MSVFDDVLEIFQTTWKTYGIINAVLSNAGVNFEDMFKEEFDQKTGKLLAPDLKSVEINLFGMRLFRKIVWHHVLT